MTDNLGVEDSGINFRIGTIAQQYIPDCMFTDGSNNDEFANNNFLFGQLDCTDNLDEDLVSDRNSGSKAAVNDFGSFSAEPFGDYLDFNADMQKLSLEMDDGEQRLETQNDDAETAAKMLNYLISIEGDY